MISVVHVISGLDVGGAEMMLFRLLEHMDRSAFAAHVISLTDIGPIGQKIRATGVEVNALGMAQDRPNPLNILRLVQSVRSARPDIVQTWMYHADLVGGLAAKLGGVPVVWGIQSSTLDPQRAKRTTIWATKICALLSRWLPTSIVCCSEASSHVHAKLGYDARKIVVVPNGIDITAFRPSPEARVALRQELGIAQETLLIGLVARFDPQKDHQSFIRAAARLHNHVSDIHFVLCGEGVNWENPDLMGWIEMAGIRDRFHLLGRRDDMPRINAALDIACSCSYYGEGFSLAIGEAMACSVPCVVTDVGDSAYIVGNAGRVVAPRDTEAVAGAWEELTRMVPDQRRALGQKARKRIEENFVIEKVARRYENLYRALCLSDRT